MSTITSLKPGDRIFSISPHGTIEIYTPEELRTKLKYLLKPEVRFMRPTPLRSRIVFVKSRGSNVSCLKGGAPSPPNFGIQVESTPTEAEVLVPLPFGIDGDKEG